MNKADIKGYLYVPLDPHTHDPQLSTGEIHS